MEVLIGSIIIFIAIIVVAAIRWVRFRNKILQQQYEERARKIEERQIRRAKANIDRWTQSVQDPKVKSKRTFPSAVSDPVRRDTSASSRDNSSDMLIFTALSSSSSSSSSDYSSSDSSSSSSSSSYD